MKTKQRLFVPVAALITTVSGFAQGSVVFDNRTSAGDAPIFAPDGVTGAGAIPNMVAELDLVNGTGLSAIYTPVAIAAFRGSAGALAKFIKGIDVIVLNVPAGSPATFVVRVYNGPSFEASLYVADYTAGQSGAVTVSALGGLPPGGGPPIPTPDLSGLQAFVAAITPEPSTVSLGVVGAAVLLLHRRK